MASALAGKQVDFTVNNPVEMVGFWDSGRVRPLAIFGPRRIPFAKWKDLPTMRELGFPIEYQMLRGIFGPPDMPTEVVAFYVEVFRKLMEASETAEFVERGAFTPAFLTGPEFMKWLEQKDAAVRSLMIKGGLAPKQ